MGILHGPSFVMGLSPCGMLGCDSSYGSLWSAGSETSVAQQFKQVLVALALTPWGIYYGLHSMAAES